VTRFEAPRGTHDILPSEQPLWQWATGAMQEVCALYGYRRIDTPGIEDTELIIRTAGGGSDVVQKETYTFEDRGGRSLTLRPEATAPICRAYIEHGLHREPQPQKLYTIGPMWRYDRPQKGRYREHWQLSVEAIGTDDPAVDAEVIQLYAELLRRLGVKQYVLELNSIGDRNCRPAYLERLTAWLDEHDADLDEEARSKRATTPLRVFDVKSERVRAALADAPKIGESLCDECREHFERVRAFLDAYGVAYELAPTLVRGLDYYTRTTFEFAADALDSAQNAVGGGGRYDGLTEQMGGPPTPGIGFGTGIERILLSSARPILDAAGNIVGAVQISLDITERKRGEEQRKLLINELNHRVKNTLAVVQSIASQIAAKTSNVEKGYIPARASAGVLGIGSGMAIRMNRVQTP